MRIKIPLYAGYLKILKVDDIESYCKKEDLYGCGDGACSAVTYSHKNCIHLVFENSTDHGIIAHESLHATNIILENATIQASYENDEAQAYLLQWVVNMCYKALNFNQIKSKRFKE